MLQVTFLSEWSKDDQDQEVGWPSLKSPEVFPPNVVKLLRVAFLHNTLIASYINSKL